MIRPKQSEPVMRNVFTARISGERERVTSDVAAGWIIAANGQIVPTALPLCGTENYTGCTIPTPNCPGGCMQYCDAFTHVTTECCPAEKCAPPDCCKEVCCELVVKDR